MKYFFGIFALPSRPEVTRLVEEHMIGWDNTDDNDGSGNVWIFAEAPDLLDLVLDMDSAEDASLAQAANGTATMGYHVPANTSSVLRSMLHDFSLNETLINHFISRHKSGNTDDSNNELQVLLRDQFTYTPQGHTSFNTLLSYDAIITLGLALCNGIQDTPLATGSQIFENMKKVTFNGASGLVAYDPDTGTRTLDTVKYQLTNIVGQPFNEDSGGNFVQLKGTTSISIDLAKSQVEEVNPFIFPDGTTSVPPTLPYFHEDKHLVGKTVIAFCYSLAAITILMSLTMIAWTTKNRHRTIVRASQPIFLYLLLLGTILMALAVFPLTFQDGDYRNLSQHKLDIGCISVHWTFALGFSLTFTAIISKMMRINSVVKSARCYRRVTVRPRHVIWPMLIIAGLNTVTLTAWTVVNPLRWHRIPLSYGRYGQIAESYGVCFELSLKEANTIPIILLALSNGASLLYANYQCYLGRTLPTEYNELCYIALTNGMMLEAVIIIFPLLFFAETDPTASLIIQTILILVACWSVLIPTFVPKFFSSKASRFSVPVQRYVKFSIDSSLDDDSKSPEQAASDEPCYQASSGLEG